ncbi:kinesin-like protein klp-3, partial [Watersipora subatra]|uniref:kinesin-like protein klp-3 n=1 Tax=Watersipora subatra TaxID=2589382 RepID=UPI00355BF3F5
DDLHRLHCPSNYADEDIVIETFYHKEGSEHSCVYHGGERFFLDSNNSWKIFPERWYDDGVIQTIEVVSDDPVLKKEFLMQLEYGKAIWDDTRQQQTNRAEGSEDDRTGKLRHPVKGDVSTYIFKEEHNVHCFFDVASGEWVKLPVCLELQSEQIQSLISEVRQQIPSWTDTRDILAALRASNYDVTDCVKNMHLAGYNSFASASTAPGSHVLFEKDQKISSLESQLQYHQHRYDKDKELLNTAHSEKTRFLAQIEELQKRVAELEVSARSSQLQVNSLSHVQRGQQDTRPKSSVPKQSVRSLSHHARLISESHHLLKLEVKQTFSELATLIKTAVETSKKLPSSGSLVPKSELEEVRALYRKEFLHRKLLYNKLQELNGNIRVFARCRFDPRTRCILNFPNDEDITLNDVRGNKQTFTFDRVYSPETSQEQVFEETRAIITSCVDGYNVCIIAYGQTGAGKTHTMMGPSDDVGVNIRAIQELLRLTNERESIDYQLSVSMVEIYNEVIHDLLTSQCNVVTAQNVGHSVTMSGLSSHTVMTEQDISHIMKTGMTNRTVASTKMNSESSRSHLLVILKVEGHDKVSNARTMGTLTLVDLAGSERLAKTEVSGQQLVEAVAINRSLSALGQVFAALGKSAMHIPFRNSKLTQVLQPSLSGDAKAVLFLAVSPAASNLAETISTMTFGSNVKQVELGVPKRNVIKPKK